MLKNNLRALSAGLLSSAILATGTPAIALPEPLTASNETEKYIISYKDNVNAADASKKVDNKGAEVEETFKHAIKGSAVTATKAEIAAIKKLPEVKSVEIDQKISVAETQQSAPWGLDRSDQRSLPLNGTYNYSPDAGKGVNVYVVDSGVLAGHTQFTGRTADGWTRVQDGLGTSDCNGHGTHVAGTTAGSTYGVAKAATVIPVRIFGCEGTGYMSDVVAGLDWIAQHHTAGTPAVANLSVGGGISATTDAAVQRVIDDGVTVVVAAGNSAADACNASPARTPAAITVAATDRNDAQASFSNFGSCVDIYAPGQSITSAWHTSTTAQASASGTSMAAPHVAGAAAVLLSRNPALTPAQVSTDIVNFSTAGLVTNATAGTPNRLLYVPEAGATPAPAPAPAPAPVTASAPSAPTDVTAEAGTSAGSAHLTWTNSASNGSDITKQTINIYENGVKTYVLDLGAQYNSVNITGLPEGKTYTFALTSTNAIGTSPESAQSKPVTIPSSATAPAAPSAVNATANIGGASLTWTKGADNGSALTKQTINVYEGTVKVKSVDVAAADTSATLSGLGEGKTYTFTVSSTNAIGTSPESAQSNAVTTKTTVKAPSAPTNVKAYAGTGSAVVTWTKGTDGGSALTAQEITVYSGVNIVKKMTVPASTTAASVAGLYNGTYYRFTVKAINNVGTSPESLSSGLVNPTAKAPGAATSVRAVAGDNAASIYWNKGVENGAPITSQIISVYSGTTKVATATVSGSYSSVKLTGLTQGRAYSFTIKEVNKMGTGVESAKTNIVTPF